MNYDKDSRPNGVDTITGEVLAEAMPWIKNITGKTIVIKYGGSAMVDEQLRAEVMADIVLLKIIGVNPVIVHGGGFAISEAMKRFDMPVKFIDGQRVTTDAAMKVVRSVLAGQVNQELVEAMNEHGRVAVGLSGADGATIIAEQASEQLGRVGRVVRINSQLLEDLVSANYIPVLASVGIGEESGSGFFNVNADVVAGHVAAAIGAHKVFFLTDVDGLYRDFDDKSTLISRISLDEVREMVDKKAGLDGHDSEAAILHPRARRGRAPCAYLKRHHAACASARDAHRQGRRHHDRPARWGRGVRLYARGQLREQTGVTWAVALPPL